MSAEEIRRLKMRLAHERAMASEGYHYYQGVVDSLRHVVDAAQAFVALKDQEPSEDYVPARMSWIRQRSAAEDAIADALFNLKFGGSSGPAYEPDASAHETPDAAQRRTTTDQGEAADSPDSPRAAASPTFTDPGDGYDSAIRWHADFERGDL